MKPARFVASLAASALACVMPCSAQLSPQLVAAPVPPTLEMHVRMEAVILSDSDGANPSGVLSLAQLHTWLQSMNTALRVAGGHITVDFNPHKDLAHVRNSRLNRLDHNSNAAAAKLASHYPGKMVVFFRAYEMAGGTASITGNGYAAYNSYAPRGSRECPTGAEGACSASYAVLPSVYCGTTVTTDIVKPGQTSGPLGPDRSGCGLGGQGGWWIYQNFEQFEHESGHYFGLPHTFPGSYDFLSTPSALQSWYQGNPRPGTTRSIAIYDGDSPNGPLITDGSNQTSGWSFTVTDTPPDAAAHLMTNNNLSLCRTETKTISDSSGASIAFDARGYTLHASYNGKPVRLRFRPDKGNIMSYFLCKHPMTYSPGQVATMRSNLVNDPQRNYLLCDDPRDKPFRPYINCKTGARILHAVPLPGGTTPPSNGHDVYTHY